MSTAYEEDVAAWAQEQVALLRSGQWALLDIEHIAEEIEDMNISHRHQLAPLAGRSGMECGGLVRRAQRRDSAGRLDRSAQGLRVEP